MASTKVDYERIARIVVDAFEVGTEKAAERWKISERTVRNYKARLETDAQLAAAFRKLSVAVTARWDQERAQAELGWRREAHIALRELLAGQRENVAPAGPNAKTSEDPKAIRKLLSAARA